MVAPINLAYLDGPVPRWSDALIAGVADVFPNPVRAIPAGGYEVKVPDIVLKQQAEPPPEETEPAPKSGKK